MTRCLSPAEELRRLWRARRVLAVTFPAHRNAIGIAGGTPDFVSVGEDSAMAGLARAAPGKFSGPCATATCSRRTPRRPEQPALPCNIPRACWWCGSIWPSSDPSPSRTRRCSPCWPAASARDCSGCIRLTSSVKPPWRSSTPSWARLIFLPASRCGIRPPAVLCRSAETGTTSSIWRTGASG